jgi:hypothetical protein
MAGVAGSAATPLGPVAVSVARAGPAGAATVGLTVPPGAAATVVLSEVLLRRLGLAVDAAGLSALAVTAAGAGRVAFEVVRRGDAALVDEARPGAGLGGCHSGACARFHPSLPPPLLTSSCSW